MFAHTQPDPYHADAKRSEHSCVRAAVSLCLFRFHFPFHAVTQAPLVIDIRVDNEQKTSPRGPCYPTRVRAALPTETKTMQ
jgi:hypothetical protein